MNDLDIIDELIDDILEEKNEFESNFNINLLQGYNLKRKCIGDIVNDNKFRYRIIPSYLSNLELFIAHERRLATWCIQGYDVQYRIKSQATTQSKIEQYRKREMRMGKIQLKKSLNDFLGIRIILPGITSNKDRILSFLESEKEKRRVSRYYPRKDGNYRGIHCYFAKDNFTFPWELQIWDINDRERNYREHELHEKQRLNESKGVFR